MVFILVATENAEAGAKLRESLGPQGWWVTIVEDREGALRAAADHEPRVVIVDADSAGALDLVRAFASANGGPGAIVLSAPDDEHQRMALVEAGADEMLSGSPPMQELIGAIERVAEAPHQVTEPSSLPIGRQLTAEEIFGDILEEVGSKVDPVGEAPALESVEGAVAGEAEADDRTGPGLAGGAEEASEREDSFAGIVEGAVSSAGDVESGRTAAGSAPLPVIEPVADLPVPLAGEQDPLAGLGFELEDPEESPVSGTVRVEELQPDVVFEPEEPAHDEESPVGVMPRVGPEQETPADGVLAESPEGSSEEGDFGQYRLEKRIAVGGMAEVWRASMVGLEGFRKTVAIKKILPHLAENDEFVAMFIDEAKLAAQLSHENLVDIYDLGKIEDEFFIAMEYVEGKDLRSILNRLRQRRERMPLELALFIASRISAALDYAHTRLDAGGEPMGLVHRDVSPRNILISNNGNVRLCDFGVAKAVSSVARTEIGALKGKIQYMSPEQAAGATVDGRSDVFSLGSVLFETVTGRRLFVEDTEITLLDAVRSGVTDEATSVRPDLPQEVNAVLRRALAKDTGERYQTAAEMQRDLDEALFLLDPKPSQGGLGRWLGELFTEQPREVASVTAPVSESVPAALRVAGEVADSPAVDVAADLSSVDAELPLATGDKSQGDTDRSEAARMGEPASSSEAETEGEAFTNVGTMAQSGRMRFWLGVAAGLLLALALAFVIKLWLDRGRGSEDAAQQPRRAPVTVSESADATPGSGPDSFPGEQKGGEEQASPRS